MARCAIEVNITADTRIVYYSLVDTLFNKIVLYTSSKKLAAYTEKRINLCKHIDEPYDIIWHNENTKIREH